MMSPGLFQVLIKKKTAFQIGDVEVVGIWEAVGSTERCKLHYGNCRIWCLWNLTHDFDPSLVNPPNLWKFNTKSLE